MRAGQGGTKGFTPESARGERIRPVFDFPPAPDWVRLRPLVRR
ncbi:hypothetical protein FRUB_00886 [Fimbriiglobus ruber]|uniref:Uncharacterized protein n=1 Tax=Fimbriiglobus ruber TaxID=1908690 RepID=A0A225EG16_9BACT|nr:hypothetical protein FRUB_00886 [Fimbriiglobus ruber]